jgi:putative ABC transport system permease protein
MPPVQSVRRVTPDYFRTVGIPLVAGRTFRDSDGEEAPNVILVNRSMAQRTWKNQDVIGKRITFDGEHYLEIVGVVGDVREFGPRQDAPVQLYRPMEQDPFPGSVMVRTAADPELLIPAVRRAVLQANPESAVIKIQTLDEARAEAVASPRTTAQLFGLFAGLALVIAVAGIGSMLALWVRQRMREIGIRIALEPRRRISSQRSSARAMVLVAVGLVGGWRGPGAHPGAKEDALRHYANRCSHLCRGVGAAPRRRTGGLLDPGAACRTDRSASRTAHRVT